MDAHWRLYWYSTRVFFVTVTLCIPAAKIDCNATILYLQAFDKVKFLRDISSYYLGIYYHRRSSQKFCVCSFYSPPDISSINTHADTVCIVSTRMLVYVLTTDVSTVRVSTSLSLEFVQAPRSRFSITSPLYSTMKFITTDKRKIASNLKKISPVYYDSRAKPLATKPFMFIHIILFCSLLGHLYFFYYCLIGFPRMFHSHNEYHYP